MNAYDLYIAYVDWGHSGKSRPVVVLARDTQLVSAFSITTQYENKSDHIKAQYMPIKKWKEAGLNKPSYIDVGRIIKLPTSVFMGIAIGRLTDVDIVGLLEAMEARTHL